MSLAFLGEITKWTLKEYWCYKKLLGPNADCGRRRRGFLQLSCRFDFGLYLCVLEHPDASF